MSLSYFSIELKLTCFWWTLSSKTCVSISCHTLSLEKRHEHGAWVKSIKHIFFCYRQKKLTSMLWGIINVVKVALDFFVVFSYSFKALIDFRSCWWWVKDAEKKRGHTTRKILKFSTQFSRQVLKFNTLTASFYKHRRYARCLKISQKVSFFRH